MLTLFERLTYLFVPAGARIPYSCSVLVWAAWFLKKTRGGLFVFPYSLTAPLKQRFSLLFERPVLR